MKGARREALWLCASLMLLLMASCATAPVSPVGETPAEQTGITLDSYALRLLDIEITPNRAQLFALRTELDRAASAPGLSRHDQAALESLRAEAAFQAGDQSAARRLVESAAAMSDAVEGVWLVRAALEPDPARSLVLLEKGIAAADTKARLLCARGGQLFKAGRYAEAAQDLDEGLRGLDPRYRALYGPDRERAFALARASRDTGSAVAPSQARDGVLTFRAMVEQAFAQTRLLASLSPSAAPTFTGVLPALVSAGLLLDSSPAPDGPALRKDVAFFLWGVVARIERDQSLLTRYRRKYTVSPVADVSVDAPWFDAVLGTVEREIMDLPDGTSFTPDGAVTVLEYLGMLGRLNRMYP
jgi:hypothetical protein